ncbi:MAG: hypothetical protein IJZ37_03095 [Clostridia bacterium]|nr:hypothetical protein [Clostridia bacterium]
MKKRILSLILCLATLMTAVVGLTACDNGKTVFGEEGDAKAQTLVIAAIKDEKTTDAALKAVEDALNEITESEYNTHVVLKFFTADEYAQKILEMSQRLAAKQQQYEDQLGASSGVSDTGTVEDPREYNEDQLLEWGLTAEQIAQLGKEDNDQISANGDFYYLDELNRPVTIYPTVSEDQLDVVFIDSIDTYYKLMQNQYIICLNNSIAANGSFRKYLNGAMLDRIYKINNGREKQFATTEAGDAFAIPNNYLTDSANYLLINKKLLDHYGYDIKCDTYVTDAVNTSGMDDLSDLDKFLKEVMKDNATNSEELKVDKVIYNYSGVDMFSYFGDDENFSLMGIISTKSYNTQTSPAADSVLKRSSFKKAMSLVYDLKKMGMAPIMDSCFYTETDEEAGFMVPRATMEEMKAANQSFAVAMVSGDTKLPEYYSEEDYYVVRTSAYEIDNQMFESMFAISTFSTTALDMDTNMWLQKMIGDYDLQTNPRAFELISMLQTNEDAVNLLTYGIEGVDYEVYENDPKVYKAGEKGDYKPVYGLGNLFLTKESDSMDSRTAYYAANKWEMAKLKIRSATCTPYC